jgi:hypothetical protein
MKTYDKAVEKIAKQYFHERHDALFATINYDQVEMAAFILDVDAEQMIVDVRTMVKENAVEWGK